METLAMNVNNPNNQKVHEERIIRKIIGNWFIMETLAMNVKQILC